MRTLVLGILAPLAAVADAPPLVINHQGRLLDADDVALTGTHEITFRLYELSVKPVGSDDVPVWTESYQAPVVDGVYSVDLGATGGDKKPLGAAEFPLDEERWLSIEVDDDGEMSPRLRVGTVAFALHAQTAGLAQQALSATSAGTAESATHATNAVNAQNATNAANATNATNATNAGHATTADTATTATKIGNKTLADLEAQFAPANLDVAALLAGETVSGDFYVAGNLGVGTSARRAASTCSTPRRTRRWSSTAAAGRSGASPCSTTGSPSAPTTRRPESNSEAATSSTWTATVTCRGWASGPTSHCRSSTFAARSPWATTACRPPRGRSAGPARGSRGTPAASGGSSTPRPQAAGTSAS
jgi:hypothetical protein